MFIAGANRWEAFDRWPPTTGAAPAPVLLENSGELSVTAPRATASGSIASSPTRLTRYPIGNRPIQLTYDARGSDWYTWLVEDQRFVHNRPDVLSWQTGPLTEDLTIAGDDHGRLFASTTGRDADWVVKLIDVYPDAVRELSPRMGGYQLMVASDILRGRYRNSWSRPAPLVPNQVTAFTVDLHQQSYSFRTGHRIMVQVQSTWFPVYDRNPQTWVPNIFEAKAADFHAETHRVYRTAKYPSRVEVAVVEQ